MKVAPNRPVRATDLLQKVRDGKPAPTALLREFIADIGSGDIPDYQAAAFLMAVYVRGLSDEQTVALTLAMRDSGRVIDLSDVVGVKVDKHSTGGVGDKISLALAPMVAACGVPVPMISGRGLGHTGGTLDKLEAIPGFRVDLGIGRFRSQVSEIGVCLIGQSDELAPADRKLYALRDVTATVESIPLITSSILSKKLAEGINALVLDVKVGCGAFMKDEASARALAESLVRVGTGAGLRVRALLTRMEEPLGRAIGNALETREAVEILRGKGPPDTTELTLRLGAEMLILGGIADDEADGRARLQRAVDSGDAFEKFSVVVEAQHGDGRVLEDLDKLPTARGVEELTASNEGFVEAIDSYALGMAAMRLGAGRERADDVINPSVGLEVLVRRGDSVEVGTPLVRVHHNHRFDHVRESLVEAFRVGPCKPAAAPLVIDSFGS